ncbi:hypothetical protein ABZ281_48265, partial [Streptomyces sp. NPDC006265]
MSEEAGGGEVRDGLTPVLRPVRAGNGFEEALEQILQVVRLGLVPGGERLPAERELARPNSAGRATAISFFTCGARSGRRTGPTPATS